jgi:hypothetical protein
MDDGILLLALLALVIIPLGLWALDEPRPEKRNDKNLNE